MLSGYYRYGHGFLSVLCSLCLYLCMLSELVLMDPTGRHGSRVVNSSSATWRRAYVIFSRTFSTSV